MGTVDQQKLASHLVTEIRENMGEEDYQREFFESLADQFERRNYLSQKQIDCLQRIYERVTS